MTEEERQRERRLKDAYRIAQNIFELVGRQDYVTVVTLVLLDDGRPGLHDLGLRLRHTAVDWEGGW